MNLKYFTSAALLFYSLSSFATFYREIKNKETGKRECIEEAITLDEFIINNKLTDKTKSKCKLDTKGRKPLYVFQLECAESTYLFFRSKKLCETYVPKDKYEVSELNFEEIAPAEVKNKKAWVMLFDVKTQNIGNDVVYSGIFQNYLDTVICVANTMEPFYIDDESPSQYDRLEALAIERCQKLEKGKYFSYLPIKKVDSKNAKEVKK